MALAASDPHSLLHLTFAHHPEARSWASSDRNRRGRHYRRRSATRRRARLRQDDSAPGVLRHSARPSANLSISGATPPKSTVAVDKV
jgi:hypothetical protein